MLNQVFALILNFIFNLFGISQNIPTSLNSPVPNLPNVENIIYQNNSYQIYSQKINPNKIDLIPNFSEKNTTQTIMQKNNCLYGANAGFYTEDNQPLGLFKSQGKFINSNIHQSNFINGFVYKTVSSEFNINGNLPNDNIDFVFQSGPLFTPVTNLKIIDDLPARRVLIGKDNNDFYLLAITTKDNNYDGPLLADTPGIFQQSKIRYTQLINLDGGAASAFYDKNGIKLNEIKPVGAFLCGK